MRNTSGWIWIGILCMTASLIQAQEGEEGKKIREDSRRGFDGAALRAVQEQIMQEAGLTLEEQERLHKLGEQDHENHKRLQKGLRNAMDSLKKAEQNVAATEQELDAAIDQVQGIQREIMKNRIMRLRRVRQVLGEEKANELMKATRRRMEARREKPEGGGFHKKKGKAQESEARSPQAE